MRIVSEKCRRALSAILAAAMVLTSAPGTTMTAMAAEQTAASAPDTAVTEIAAEQAADGSEEAAADNTAVPEEGEKNALEGDGSEGETDNGEDTDIQELESPVFTLNPSDGYVQNGEEASFTLTVPENSEVKYVIGEAGQSEAEVADPTTDDATYNMEPVSVPAPDDIEGTTVVVKAVAVPAGDKADSFTSSAVVSAAFTFGPKKEAASEGEDPPIVLSAPVIVLSKTEADNRAEDVTFTLEDLSDGIVKYTVDGTDPLDSSTAVEYTEETGAVHVEAPDTDEQAAVTVRAATVANRGGFTDSSVSSATVTFDGKKVTLTVDSKNYDAFTVELKETVAGQEKPLTVGEDHTVKVTKGAEISGEVRVKDDYEFVSVNFAETQWLDRADDKANVIVACEAVSGDLTLAVETKLAYEPRVYNEKFDYLAKLEKEGKNAGRYVIDPGNYTFSILTKTGKLIPLDAATILIGGKAYTGDTQPEVRDDGTIALKIGKDLYGKDFGLEFKSGTKEADAASAKVSDTASFRVNDLLTEVKVKGADQKGGLTQAVRTTESYDLTYTPSTEGVRSQLAAFSTDAEKVDAITIDGKLWLTTAGEKTEKPVSVILYNTLLRSERELSEAVLREAGAVVAEVKVTVAEPAWAKTALAVKYADGTDTQIKVSVTAPAGVKADGDYYYIFDVMDPSTVSGNLSAQPRYFVERAETGTKTYTLKVIDAEAGKGTKKEFQVKAYLVRMDDAKAPVDLKDPGIVAQTKEPKAVKCFTKNPCYADRISLKKGTTAVYSGQQNVQIATINFGKNTSYVDHATAELVQKDNQRRKVLGYDIQARVVDGRVYADIGENTIPGKYTIRVKADAPTGAKPAEACIVITVAAGLHDIILESESESIYKAAGKAARAKATIGYDWYNQTFKPKNLKISYAVGSLDSAGSFTEDKNVLLDARQKPAVTVKNGSITISKDYQVKENPDENRFAVRVTVKSSIGVEKSATEEFCISADGQEFEKLIIIRPQLVTYDLVLDADQETYEASRLQGARVLVVRKGAQPGTDGKYAVDDLLLPGEGQYTLTVKGKGVTVDDSNNITVKDCTAKGISFTAQAKDGSGNKVSLKIDQLKYDEYDESEVCVAFGSELGGWTELSSESGNNLSVLENRLQLGSGDWYYLRVMKKDEQGNLYEGDRFINYSLAVSGGARILTDMGEGSTWHARNQWVRVQITGENATVTLKKGQKQKPVASYTMISEICEKEIKAPVITLAKGQKDLVVGKSGQSLVFDVKDSGCDSKLPEYARFDPKACDAKSADFFGLCGDWAKGVALNTGKTTYDPQTGKLTIPVGDVFAAGSGTLYLSIFYWNDDGSITRLKLTKGIRIKAVDLKESFSMTKKYTISMMDARSVALQYKGNGVQDVKIEELYSENSKGTISPFWKTFDIGDDERSLQLRPGCEDMAGQRINGYIKVSVSYENGNIKEYESKVTVSVLPWGQTANKYTASIAKLKSNMITAEDAQNMAVTISAGRNKTVPGVREVAGSVYGADGKETAITADLTEDGKVALDLTGYIDQNKEKGKTQKVIVKVLFDSAYRTKVEAYVPLQVTVSVPQKMSYKE